MFFFDKKVTQDLGGPSCSWAQDCSTFFPRIIFWPAGSFFPPPWTACQPKMDATPTLLEKEGPRKCAIHHYFCKKWFFKNFRACGGHDASLIFWWPRQTSAPCGIDSARRDLSIGAFSAHSNMSVEKFSQIQLRSRKCRKNQ